MDTYWVPPADFISVFVFIFVLLYLLSFPHYPMRQGLPF